MRRADICMATGLLFVGLLMLFVIIPAEADGDTWSGVSPLFFPTLIAAGFSIGGAALLDDDGFVFQVQVHDISILQAIRIRGQSPDSIALRVIPRRTTA